MDGVVWRVDAGVGWMRVLGGGWRVSLEAQLWLYR